MSKRSIEKGDIILADQHYGKTKSFDYVVGASGDFVMRLKHEAANYFDKDEKIDLLTLLGGTVFPLGDR